MHRDGILQDYQSYGILPEVEAEWIQELISNWSHEYKEHFVVTENTLKLLQLLRRRSLGSELRELLSASLQHSGNMDDFSKLLIAECVADFAPTIPPDVARSALELLSSHADFGAFNCYRIHKHLAPLLTAEHLQERARRCKCKLTLATK